MFILNFFLEKIPGIISNFVDDLQNTPYEVESESIFPFWYPFYIIIFEKEFMWRIRNETAGKDETRNRHRVTHSHAFPTHVGVYGTVLSFNLHSSWCNGPLVPHRQPHRQRGHRDEISSGGVFATTRRLCYGLRYGIKTLAPPPLQYQTILCFRDWMDVEDRGNRGWLALRAEGDLRAW